MHGSHLCNLVARILNLVRPCKHSRTKFSMQSTAVLVPTTAVLLSIVLDLVVGTSSTVYTRVASGMKPSRPMAVLQECFLNM